MRMNLSLAFFHGEQALVAVALGGFIVVVAVPLVFHVWLRLTKSSELKLTYIYVLSTAVLFVLTAFTMHDERSLSHLTLATMAFILTLPWNAITLMAITLAGNSDISDREILFTMVLGAGINAMILYLIAKKAKGWRR